MREMGGYIELDNYLGQEHYPDLIALNCGRNCLAYLTERKNIKKLFLPYFLCNSVSEVCERNNVKIEYYHINENFRPEFNKDLDEAEWLYIVNYYGQISDEEIIDYKSIYVNIIIDNAQAFFQKPLEDVDTLYTCRKFFGVADGAYLSTDVEVDEELEQDISFSRMNFLLGRYEKTASEFYSEYVANNDFFVDEEIKRMSKLTHNLLRGLDYKQVKKKREENFRFLHENLKEKNQLKLIMPAGPFMYPLWLENGAELRRRLLKEKIYIPTLWPNVFELCDADSLEYRMAEDIFPLPVDQRYGIEDMKYIFDSINRIIN